MYNLVELKMTIDARDFKTRSYTFFHYVNISPKLYISVFIFQRIIALKILLKPKTGGFNELERKLWFYWLNKS